MTWSLVSAGTAVQGSSGGTIAPAPGVSPTANNLLVIPVTGVSTTAADDTIPPAPSGWNVAVSKAAAGRCEAIIFWKKAAGGETAPTIAAQAGELLAGQFLEYNWSVSGVNFLVDQTASNSGTTGTSLVATAGGADAGSGALAVMVASAEYASAATHTISHALNNGTATQRGNNNSTSTREHYSIADCITTGNGSADVDTVSIAATPVDTVAALATFKAVTPTTTSVAEVKLESPPDGTPATLTNFVAIVHAEVAATATDTVLNLDLYQGSTRITSATLTTSALTTSPTESQLHILDADAGSITDTTNLRFRFWGTSATGDTSTVRVTQLELQTPAGSSTDASVNPPSALLRLFANPATVSTITPVNVTVTPPSAFLQFFAPLAAVISTETSIGPPSAFLRFFSNPAAVAGSANVTPPSAFIRFRSQPAGVSTGTNVTITPPSAFIRFAAPAATVAAVQNVTVISPSAFVSFRAAPAQVSASANITPVSAFLRFRAPLAQVSVGTNVTVTPPSAFLRFRAPAATVAGNANVTPPSAFIRFRSQPGTVSTGTSVTVAPPSAFIRIRGVVPNVSTTRSANVTPASAFLRFRAPLAQVAAGGATPDIKLPTSLTLDNIAGTATMQGKSPAATMLNPAAALTLEAGGAAQLQQHTPTGELQTGSEKLALDPNETEVVLSG